MGITIRNATLNDLDTVTEIEAVCFPAAEAATRESFEDRLKTFADSFFIAECLQLLFCCSLKKPP